MNAMTREEMQERCAEIERTLDTAPLRPDQRALLMDELLTTTRAIGRAPQEEPTGFEEMTEWT